jgi:hypothetical protein
MDLFCFKNRTVFETKHTLGRFLRKMKPKKDKLNRPQNVYKIPSVCGREYTGETGTPFGVRIREH